ncbi:MAG: TRAP transporter small permease [Pararhodobacter sp.]
MLRALDRYAGWVIVLTAVIGTLGLLTEVGLILADVTGRYFGAPIRGAQDITQMAMVVLVFGGMALCDRQGGHISVDLFERRFPDWLNHTANIVSAILGAVIFLGIAWTTWESAGLSRLLNSATNILRLPKYWFQYYVIFASLVAVLGMSLRAVILIVDGPVRRPKPELGHPG